MRYSIKQKLFLVVTMILTTFFLIMYLINVYLLDDIFIWSSKKAMTYAYNDFEEKIKNGYDIESILYEADNKYDGNITIIDNKENIIYSTYSKINRLRIDRFFSTSLDWINNLILNMKNDTAFMITPEEGFPVKSIIFLGKLPQNRVFIAERPMHIIYDNSKLAGRFIVFSGLITLLIASITVYFVSVKVTKPIIHMNQIAQGIANLDFDKKVNVSNNDEIGMLGNSINNISGKLSNVLNQLIQANEKLKNDIEHERKLEKMRRRFVSSVSHELKTPISMIQGYADGLKFNIARNPEDMQYYCDVIIEESEKMSHLIKDLLDLSSYEAGTFKITKSEFDFVILIKEIGEKYRKVLMERNVKLEVILPEECLIQADRLRIEQVLSNFMSNAVNHVDSKGIIKVMLDKKDDELCLSLYNTGSHIDDSELENIWTSFYKLEANNYFASAGTGLGLAIVKAIIDLHSGQCGAENIAEGVEFWISMPI